MSRKQKPKKDIILVTMEVVDGFVWCDRVGEVHEDTLNPYEWPESETDYWCSKGDHYPVYVQRHRS